MKVLTRASETASRGMISCPRVRDVGESHECLNRKAALKGGNCVNESSGIRPWSVTKISALG